MILLKYCAPIFVRRKHLHEYILHDLLSFMYKKMSYCKLYIINISHSTILFISSFLGKEEERQMFQQMQAMAQKQVTLILLFINKKFTNKNQCLPEIISFSLIFILNHFILYIAYNYN